MSTHNVPGPNARMVISGCQRLIRQPEIVTVTEPDWILTFTPDLTAPQLVVFGNIVASVGGAVSVTPEERTAIEGDIATLRAFFLAPTPTAAQNVTATKSLIKVIRAILRD